MDNPKQRCSFRQVATLAVIHFVTLVGATVWQFGRSMARFDTGDDGGWFDAALQGITTVLGFPVLQMLSVVPPSYFSGLSGYLPFVANSILWGVGLTLLLRRLPRRVNPLLTAAIFALFVTQAWGVEQLVQLKTSSGTLHGTLNLPVGTAPCPAVVIMAGSGATDRDGNQASIKNDSLKLLGQALAANGIAALRYDKRGVAESAAAITRAEDLRLETYVADAVQWIASLRENPRFLGVGLIGHSEGSLVGILAALRTKVDAFVSLAGSGRAAAALIRQQLDGKLTASLEVRNNQILDELVAGRTVTNVPKELLAIYHPSVQPYLISWFKYDPAREIAKLNLPVLIVQGTTDLQVSINDAKLLAAAKKDAKLRLIEGMNHVLKHATVAAEQQAAHTDPTLPINAQAVREITTFLTTDTGTTDTRSNLPPQNDR